VVGTRGRARPSLMFPPARRLRKARIRPGARKAPARYSVALNSFPWMIRGLITNIE
jgi:hypothetical protein